MLVIERSRGEEIKLKTSDGDIVIKCLKTAQGYTEIGIDAPKHVKILRSEIQFKDLDSSEKAPVPAMQGKETQG
jgi:carbon storage regulator CsrA